MDDEVKQPSNGLRVLGYVIGLLIVVGGGVYSMVELRVSPIDEKVKAARELTDFRIKDLRSDLDALVVWRNSWVQRVLQLDEKQNGKHTASERETRRLRAHLGLPN